MIEVLLILVILVIPPVIGGIFFPGKRGRMIGPNGTVKNVKVGYSWTMFFWGSFVPLIRGDIKWFFISLLLSIISLGIAWLVVLPFVYNKVYIKDLIEKGYKPESEELESFMRTKGIIA